MSANQAYREPIYGHIKRGIYGTRRYPWGTKTPQDASQNLGPEIHLSPFEWRTNAGISDTVMPADQGVRYLEIQNLSLTNDISIGFGQRASAISGILLTPGQTHIWDTAVPQDSIDIFCTAALQRVHIEKGR